MKLAMHPNSLFAVLLRSPWWVSLLAAAGMFALLRLVIPPVYAAFATLPLGLICGVAAWRQLRTPSAARTEKTLEQLRAMSWDEFAARLEEAFRREGYGVSRIAGAAAELELTQGWRVTLVACKRWKAGRTGIEPLRELDAAKRAHSAHECIYVTAGEITENARTFAAEKGIRLLSGAELARLMAKS